jgi:hypothetical protein
MWNMDTLRQVHVARGWSLPRLEEAWAELQWPDFGPLDGYRFVFASSHRDSIAPLQNISAYLEPMLRAGAEVSVYEVPAVSHRTTVVVGLWKGPQLVRLARLLPAALMLRHAEDERHHDDQQDPGDDPEDMGLG